MPFVVHVLKRADTRRVARRRPRRSRSRSTTTANARGRGVRTGDGDGDRPWSRRDRHRAVLVERIGHASTVTRWWALHLRRSTDATFCHVSLPEPMIIPLRARRGLQVRRRHAGLGVVCRPDACRRSRRSTARGVVGTTRAPDRDGPRAPATACPLSSVVPKTRIACACFVECSWPVNQIWTNATAK